MEVFEALGNLVVGLIFFVLWILPFVVVGAVVVSLISQNARPQGVEMLSKDEREVRDFILGSSRPSGGGGYDGGRPDRGWDSPS
jgi:hypothetical protein